MNEDRSLPAFTMPGMSRRVRCGCLLSVVVPRSLKAGRIVHDPATIVREPCVEHRAVRRFRAEEKVAGQPATLGTVEALVEALNREVG
jgi:hypothetical protein